MTQWYYADRNRQRQGPVEAAELAALFRRNEIGLDSLVWRAGLEQWQALRDFTGELGLLPAAAAAPTPAPVATPPDAPATTPALLDAGRGEVAAAETTAPVQAAAVHAPTTSAATLLEVSTDADIVYAGFWKRVAASVIDVFAIGLPLALVLGLVNMAMGGSEDPLDPTWNAISVVATALVYAAFHSSASFMATPGKLAIGIKVVRGDGEKIGYLRGVARYFASILSALLLCIGYLMAAFTQRKQALHDLICDTVVVDKWAFTDEPHRQRRELGALAIVALVIGALLVLTGALAVLALGALFAQA